jgi:hypothetical protein
MITLEASKRAVHSVDSFKPAHPSPAVEIRFRFIDGSVASFVQHGKDAVENLRHRLEPARLFKQKRIVVADDYSKSVFVCSQINRIDFIFDEPDFDHLPADHADMVEISEREFRRHVPLENPLQLERRVQRRRVGDLIVSFLSLHLTGGESIYLMNEILVKPPADSQTFMRRLLSKDGLAVRLAGGGAGVINLSNLIGYSVYPGVPEVPADSWFAEPKPA